MAYTPINWQNGDTITAEKLNKCDNGWGMESTVIFSESITTSGSAPAPMANLTYATAITADELTVTFDGTSYTVTMLSTPMGNMYGEVGSGGPSFANYPFCIVSADGMNMVYTETAGTYTISASSLTVEVSSNFTQAAYTALANTVPFLIVPNTTTWQEVYDAMTANRLCFVKDTDTDSVAFYMVTLVCIDNGTYEVSALYSDGGSAAVRYYNANSANGAIYAA